MALEALVTPTTMRIVQSPCYKVAVAARQSRLSY